jgi:hypothetical protein
MFTGGIEGEYQSVRNNHDSVIFGILDVQHYRNRMSQLTRRQTKGSRDNMNDTKLGDGAD